EELLNKLDKKYRNDYDYWLRILSCCKSTNLDYAWEIFEEWSSKGKNHNKENNKEIWDNLIPHLDINFLYWILRMKKCIRYTILNKPLRLTFDEDSKTYGHTKKVKKPISIDYEEINKKY